MTDQTPTPPPPPPAEQQSTNPDSSGVRNDPWTIWLSRLIQVFGLLGFLHELVLGDARERPYILMVCVAMMLGGAGLQLILRWALARLP